MVTLRRPSHHGHSNRHGSVYHAASGPQLSAKRGPANICDECGCLRSAHVGRADGGACRVCGDKCPGMMFDRPPEPGQGTRRRMTDAEATEAKRLLDAGLTYDEVARKLRWHNGDRALRYRFPGYNQPGPVKAELGDLDERLKRLGLR